MRADTPTSQTKKNECVFLLQFADCVKEAYLSMKKFKQAKFEVSGESDFSCGKGIFFCFVLFLFFPLFSVQASVSDPAAVVAAETPAPAPAVEEESSIFRASRHGVPSALTDELIEQCEKDLAVKLPVALVSVLRKQNGGFLSRSAHPAPPNAWASNQ
jgi:hypothetical protein